MRVLLLLISICLICISCGSSKLNKEYSDYKIAIGESPFFSEGKNQSVFRGEISIFKHYYSGIFALKKEAENKYRMVLMSEVGMTLFDMSFTNSDYKLNYCIEPIKKKSLLQLMHQDFLLLTQMPPKHKLKLKNKKKSELVEKWKHIDKRDFYYSEKGQLTKIISKSFLNNTKIEFKDVNKGVSNIIKIQHSPVKLKMELKRIK